MADPSQIVITMVQIFRIPRASGRKLRRGCDSFVPAWRFAALQTGRTLFLGGSHYDCRNQLHRHAPRRRGTQYSEAPAWSPRKNRHAQEYWVARLRGR